MSVEKGPQEGEMVLVRVRQPYRQEELILPARYYGARGELGGMLQMEGNIGWFSVDPNVVSSKAVVLDWIGFSRRGT